MSVQTIKDDMISVVNKMTAKELYLLYCYLDDESMNTSNSFNCVVCKEKYGLCGENCKDRFMKYYKVRF